MSKTPDSAPQARHPYETQIAMRGLVAKAAAAGPVGFIDVGSHKIAALIGALAPTPAGVSQFRILGAGIARSAGVAGGAVRDVGAAAKSIIAAIRQAETIAGQRPKTAMATLSGARPRSVSASAEGDLPAAIVKSEDIARIVAAAAPPAEAEDRMRLHAVATRWRVDGWDAPGDPTGRAGRRLGVDMHSISVDRQCIRDLASALKAADMTMIGVGVSAYAAAIACLNDQDRAIGAACIDIGADSSGIALFQGGRLSYVDTAPFGGEAITSQIAQSFGLAREDAEQLKIAEGCASLAVRAGNIEAKRVGGGPPLSLDRASLAAAIRPRALDLMDLARNRLAQVGFLSVPGRPIVFTGGGAELEGLGSVAEEIFGPRVRLGAPAAPEGLVGMGPKGAWSASIGLVRLAAGAPETPFGAPAAAAAPSKKSGLLAWLRETW
ncbi:MAG: cell division protein FtsA [Neomegalonema sp.]|nr:cell division protein FtsA [Neomegalonema sp.]